MKKKILMLLCLLSVPLCLSGCMKNDRPSVGDPVVLTMWHVYGSQTKSPLNAAIDEFNDTLGIREIDNLFAFLAERDSHHEEQLTELEKAKQQAEQEAEQSKAAYDRALEKYQLHKVKFISSPMKRRKKSFWKTMNTLFAT